MNLQETIQQLEEMGTAQNRKVYARHGVGQTMFGVSYANLNKLAKSQSGATTLSPCCYGPAATTTPESWPPWLPTRTRPRTNCWKPGSRT